MAMLKIGENNYIDTSKIVSIRAFNRRDFSRYKTKHWWTGQEYYVRKGNGYYDPPQVVIWIHGKENPFTITYDFFDGYREAVDYVNEIIEVINSEKKNAKCETCSCNSTTD